MKIDYLRTKVVNGLRGPYCFRLKDREEFRALMRAVGPDAAGLELMLDKTGIYPLYLKEVKNPAANILKQQMLSLGGEAVLGRSAINMAQEESDVLLLGTVKHYKALTGKLQFQPWGLKGLGTRIGAFLEGLDKKEQVSWRWPGLELTVGKRTLVMGILNITPDSFSDGGKFFEPQKALEHAMEMVAAGADIIDVGGESTRPGAQPVSTGEELARVMPVLELLLKETAVPISLDTYKADTAREALSRGVHIINYVGGGKKDEERAMAKIVAGKDVPVIIMHNQKRDCTHPYELVTGLIDDLAESVRIFEDAGVKRDKMVIDPGIGFGKDARGNLIALHHLEAFRGLNLPVLLGVSRKSFIGAALDAPVEKRMEGSLAAAAWGMMNGAAILRVHDVRETVRVVRMLEAIGKAGEDSE